MTKHPEANIPPQNVEAEQSVLGAIMLDNGILDDIMEILHPEHFYRAAHQKIYQSMIALDSKDEPIDIITLNNHLKQRNQLENVGDTSYITYLSSSIPTAANAQYYANIVKEKALYRKMMSAGLNMSAIAQEEPEDIGGAINKVEQMLCQIGSDRTKSQLTKVLTILPECFDSIEKAYELKRPITGITSGFRELDDMTAGFQDSDLIIIAGRPSMGKTALALNIARNVAGNDLSAAVFSLEMSKEQLATRMLCSDANVNSASVRNGRLDENDHRRLVAAAGHLGECQIYIDDTPAITINEIRSKCRRLKNSEGLDVITVDYLQLMKGANKRNDREQEIASITRALKALAKELDVPVIALSQLNRNLEARPDKRPRLSDLRESGAIEQDADLICFVYRDEVYTKDTKDKGVAELIIGKQRNGPIGTVRLNFIKKYTKFEEIQKQEDWYDEGE